ncbi:recombinase family protein [Agromyces archimandritae]|uniref:Recombinase family protein n=1 Tax=Agromyces archimandritae TaxID=2781962 RepID=A0A975ING7_9MICO|nr:recombinase family protein [Agromyces archimandritae]QTX04550.1 recombinase family protein [Agromyces archimandritae]
MKIAPDQPTASERAKLRAVLYYRLSRDSEVSTSIRGQDADLSALAAREGWDVIATFTDEGLSGGKRRANADEAVRMLRESEVDVLAAYAVDRFSRMGIGEDAELVRIVRAAPARRPARVVFMREGIDSATDAKGWAIRFMIASEMALGERDVMVQRRKAALRRMQNEGRFTGRGAPPYGYRSAPFDDGRAGRRLVPDATEAEVVREGAARLLAGESSMSLARALTERGVPLARSAYRLAQIAGRPLVDDTGAELARGTWTNGRVSQLWTSHHLLGRIMRDQPRGEAGGHLDREGSPVLDPRTGEPLEAFEPILDLSTFLALRERFQRSVGRGKQQKRRAARLLSGLLYCGLCGAKSYALTVRQRGREYAYYRCSGASRGESCFGPRIRAEHAEELVEAEYLATVGRLPAYERVEHRGEEEQSERLARIAERVGTLSRQLIEPGVDRLAIVAELDRLDAERDAALALAPTLVVEYVPLGVTWAEVYGSGNLSERRRALARAYDHVLAYPEGRGPDGRRLVPVLNPDAPEDHDAA